MALSEDGSRRMSVTQEAYVAIREMLLAGDLPPGSRVTVRPIVEKLGLSATPVKAALINLEREGVLELKVRRGFFVPEIGDRDMREIFQMRAALDRLAGHLTASSDEHGTIAQQLRAECATQRTHLDAGEVDAYRRADIQFHNRLWQLSGNRRLQRSGEQLMDQMRLSNSVSARQPGRVERSLAEHLTIVDAIAAGDAGAAAEAAASHIRSVECTFFEVREHPDGAASADAESGPADGGPAPSE